MIEKFNVCISVNDNYDYYKNMPMVYMAWKSYFPKCNVVLGFVNCKNPKPHKESGVHINDFLNEYCDQLFIVDEIGGIPTENQGKFLRYWVASQLPDNEICLIHDIDSLPLQKNYWDEHIFSHFDSKKLLAVGYDVYLGTEHEGKFPASNMLGTSQIFKKLVNPQNKSYQELVFGYCEIRMFDEKERLDQIKNLFSDESLIRYMIVNNLGLSNVNHIDRKINIVSQWLDKTFWRLDFDRLKKGGYIECNLPRGFDIEMSKIKESDLQGLYYFIETNYMILQNGK